MISTRSPTKLKQTPSTKAELLGQWQRLYDKLITVYLKSRALEIIGHKYGVSRQTVMYHLFTDYKNNQKKQPSKSWSYEKQKPARRQRRIDYGAKYMAAKRHINEMVGESYRRAAPQEVLTLGNLREAIFDISGIAFQPSTLEGLIKQFEVNKGYPLLVKVPGHEQPHYRLSEEIRK